MNVIADLFPEFAEHRTPSEDAEIFVRTGGSGPPLALYGFPQTHMCEDDRVGAGSDLERDEAICLRGASSRALPSCRGAVRIWVALGPIRSKPGKLGARRCPVSR